MFATQCTRKKALGTWKPVGRWVHTLTAAGQRKMSQSVGVLVSSLSSSSWIFLWICGCVGLMWTSRAPVSGGPMTLTVRP
ncbi:unnamed protein product [Vitrella brassicaformis CCMP3155]|uniref:Uncharacterized protein n=1 Tax=Vitrella brassicaformis (strain CCMP3155) TaxID=1169540 RepID=A0A0G4ER80_VITBC|nr:unnamed protein product [Vitrella brassicaformis CCMP3155]|eukprot:CEL99771.1 unnamed protein product [Vitrella brassicaformis CCMP3155]